jgi:Domain of unknown function (DUF4280)
MPYRRTPSGDVRVPKQVVNGAMLMCSMGTSPSSLTVLPVNMVDVENKPSATIQDFVPMVNIMPFGMCISPANPQVAAATAAAMGVLTPQPCIPMTTSPWAPGATQTYINNIPALDDASKCNCVWAGIVSITFAGQISKDVV